MRSSRYVCSTATALHRVFITPIEQSQHQLLIRTSPPTLRATSSKLLLLQRRCYASPVTARRLPRDDEIKSWSVSLVNEQGKLEEPRSTSDILHSIDRSTQSLVVIVPGEPGTPPICKILNKKAMRDAEKAKTKGVKNPASTTKTIELSWGIDGNDLGHRLAKMKEFLGKGNKVEMVLAKKRKGKVATPEQAYALVARIKEAIEEVNGAKESKPMYGKLLETATIYADGTVPQK